MLHLPGGTSNGLACSVGTEDPVSAALAIAKHLAVPWDAVAVNVGYGQWTGDNACIHVEVVGKREKVERRGFAETPRGRLKRSPVFL
jgi:hypothetical protein